MLCGRDLAGRDLDQCGQVLAGEPTNLDAKALGLRVKLRPVSDSCGRRVEEPKQAAQRTVVDVGPRLLRGKGSIEVGGHKDDRAYGQRPGSTRKNRRDR